MKPKDRIVSVAILLEEIKLLLLKRYVFEYRILSESELLWHRWTVRIPTQGKNQKFQKVVDRKKVFQCATLMKKNEVSGYRT